jgi:RNA polymerase sigma-70 factor (ECF subfamily)
MGVEFEDLTAPYRRELLAHCYRMSGSAHDAEDLVQETLLRAWRAFGTYDQSRASLRTWLYRIATNACLTALKGRARRPLPSGLVAALDDPQAPMRMGAEVPWLQPWRTDPADVVAARSRMRLAFVATLQFLPPRQRAILLLRDVLEFSAAEVASDLGTSTAAVNSGLQRARSRVGNVAEEDLRPPEDPAVVERYVAAFERADLDTLRSLLVADAVLEMPPVFNWYAGADAYAAFIARVWQMRGTDWRLLPMEANGQPAVAAYAAGRAHTVQVFSTAGPAIARTVVFQDERLFTAFGLPLTLPR